MRGIPLEKTGKSRILPFLFLEKIARQLPDFYKNLFFGEN